MKQSLLYALLIGAVLCSQQLCAQVQDSLRDENPVLTYSGLTYLDILDSLSCKSRSFEDKYLLFVTMGTMTPFDKVLDIYNKMRSSAKVQKEKKYALGLYAATAHLYLQVKNDPNMAKLYLDSAHQYIGKVKDPGNLGIYYLIEGSYYSAISDESSMIKSYYTSISYLHEDGRRKLAIMKLLYAIAGYYYQFADSQGLKTIKNKTLALAKEIDEPTPYIQSYSVAATYHEVSWQKDSIPAHRDSAIYYQRLVIDAYNCADSISKAMNNALVVQNYCNMAEFMIENMNTTDCTYTWDEVAYCIKMGKDLWEEGDIINYHRLYYLQAMVCEHAGKYKESLQYAEKSLGILNSELINTADRESFVRVYALLAKLEEQRKDYKAALKYTKLSSDLQIELQSEERYKVGKELEAGYETAQKDLRIATLQVEQEREKRNKLFILGIGVLIVIILIVFLLYSRIQRLKKEKEASELSIRMKERELEFQTAIAQSELHGMQSYLKGLETERERLAKELHDNVANELLSLDFRLKEVSQVPDETFTQIENLHNEIRNISHELAPPLFKYAGLCEIITDYLLKISKKTIAIDCQVEDESTEDMLDRLSDRQALEIYRIIQEATSNIVKHAEATMARVVFGHAADRLALTIEDNGKGFDMDRRQAGIGLRIIADRVAGLNGEIHISAEPGSGCKIRMSFPPAQ